MQLILNSQKLQSCLYCFILLYTINLCSLGGQRLNRYSQIQADTIRSKATLNSEFRTPNSKFYDVLSTVQNQSFFGTEPFFNTVTGKSLKNKATVTASISSDNGFCYIILICLKVLILCKQEDHRVMRTYRHSIHT